LRPNYTDEQIYQNARRILIGEYQHILYEEWLPVLLGPALAGSILPPGTNSTTYNPHLNPSILNEVSTAAHRYGHTFLNGFFNLNDPFDGHLLDFYLLRFVFNNSTRYAANPDFGMRTILKGLTLQGSQSFDHFFTVDVTLFYLARPDHGYQPEEDLMVRNIQRARNHAIHGWAHYRRLCSNATVSWANRPADIAQEAWTTLKRLYQKVEDIELFMGGIAERPIEGIQYLNYYFLNITDAPKCDHFGLYHF
jgi:peroxidase